MEAIRGVVAAPASARRIPHATKITALPVILHKLLPDVFFRKAFAEKLSDRAMKSAFAPSFRHGQNRTWPATRPERTRYIYRPPDAADGYAERFY